MNEKAPQSLYQLKKKLIEEYGTIFNPKTAETFIKNAAGAFAPEDHFSVGTKDDRRYHYTEDFSNLVFLLAEAEVNRSQDLHPYLLQCKKCSISFKDMEHFLYVLLFKGKPYEKLTARIQDVLLVLHFINYKPRKLNDLTDKAAIKKKLLFYLIAENNHTIKITENLTLSELQEKLFSDENTI